MSRDRVTKVLDVESSLEAGCKKAAKGSDQRGKGSHNETVDLEGGVGDGRWGVAEDSLKKLPRDTGELETVPHKDRVGSASHLREDIGSKITGRADHVRISHPECTPSNAEQKSADESAHEAFDSLLRTQLDQRSLTEKLAANVGHNIVTDDQGRRDEEPHQTFENVVHDEMARHHNEQE